MNKNFHIDILKELKIIRCKHWGTTTLRDLGRARIELKREAERYDYKFHFLTDYRDIILAFDIDDFPHIWCFIEKHQATIEGKVEAVLISKPLVCAYGMLIRDECKKRFNYEVRLFSTEEAALWWLKMKGHVVSFD